MIVSGQSCEQVHSILVHPCLKHVSRMLQSQLDAFRIRETLLEVIYCLCEPLQSDAHLSDCI